MLSKMHELGDLNTFQLFLILYISYTSKEGHFWWWKVICKEKKACFLLKGHTKWKYELKQIIPVIFMLYLDLPHSKRVQWLRVLKKEWIIYDNWAKSAGHYLNDTYTKKSKTSIEAVFFHFPTEVSTELTGDAKYYDGEKSFYLFY